MSAMIPEKGGYQINNVRFLMFIFLKSTKHDIRSFIKIINFILFMFYLFFLNIYKIISLHLSS